jgi:hypothetical protein
MPFAPYQGKRTFKGGKAMTKTQLMKKIAHLESINDQLSTEICYLDRLMRVLGFSQGLESMKATAEEVIEEGILEKEELDSEE